MIIPLGDMVSDERNIYELTNAIIRRTEQLLLAGDPELDKNNGKVVSTAIKEIVSLKIGYEYTRD